MDLGGGHAVGGRRASNRGVLFERMVTFHVAFVLFSETKAAFSVCSDHGDYGKFQDLVVEETLGGRSGRRSDDHREAAESSSTLPVEAIELKHSQRELGERHFCPRTGKYRLTAFLKSYREKKATLGACERLTLATNNTFDHSVAGNFRKSDGCWYLYETDLWALKEGSQLRRDLGGVAADEDIEAFCGKLRLATGLPDADALRERIKRKLGEIYGAEGYRGATLLSFYLHLKDNFERWFDHEPRAMTRDIMERFVSDAKHAVNT